MTWAPDGELAWTIQIRCGGCGSWAELGVSNAQASHLDVVLDRQAALMTEAVERLERERVEHDFQMLIEALHQDLIGPDDFDSPRLRQAAG
jgi:hypothetical protein